jgi:histidinol-phosphate/aromatic aminotransferase/cobyric acid decarboxylase-like protein
MANISTEHEEQELRARATWFLADITDRLGLCADELGCHDSKSLFLLIKRASLAARTADQWQAVGAAKARLAAVQEANEGLEDALRTLVGLLEEERKLAAAS